MSTTPASKVLKSTNKKVNKKGEDVSAVGKKSEPPSTTTSPILSLLGDAKDAKDRRAYEVARQQARRPADRRKAKDQKSKRHPQAGVTTTGVATVSRSRSGPGNILSDSDEVDDLDSPIDSEPKSPNEINGVPRSLSIGLEDLVRNAKVRKEKAGDFELIPHIRPVLALDDSEVNFDTKAETTVPDFVDDDWEHVESCSSSESSASSSDEDEAMKQRSANTGARSYAQVLTMTHDIKL